MVMLEKMYKYYVLSFHLNKARRKKAHKSSPCKVKCSQTPGIRKKHGRLSAESGAA